MSDKDNLHGVGRPYSKGYIYILKIFQFQTFIGSKHAIKKNIKIIPESLG